MRTKPLLFVAAAAFALVIGAAVLWHVAAAEWLMPALAERIAAASGLRLSADGPLRATLLPAPGLRAAGIRIAGAGERPLVRADSLEVDIRWWPLLRGRVELAQGRLLRARALAEPLLPPADIEAEGVDDGLEVTIVADGGTVRATVQRQGSDVLLSALRAAAGPWMAVGSGRLALGPDLRLVATLDRIERGDRLLGAAALAVGYGADGVILERGTWRSVNGMEAAAFGHAAAEGGVLRFEGGLESFAPAAGGLELTARLDGTFGSGGLALTAGDIDLRGLGSHLTGTAKYVSSPRRLSAELRLDRVTAALMQELGDKLPMAAVAVPDADLDLRLRVAQLDAGALSAEGIVVDLAREQNVVELRELAARSLAGQPLRASGRISLGTGAITMEPASLHYGAVDATGRLQLDLAGARPRIAADLTTGPLTLDRWFAGPPPLPPEPMTRRAQAVAIAAAARRAAAPPAWSAERLPLPPPLGVDVDLGVAAPSVTWHGQRFDDAHLKARLGEARLDIDSLSAAAYGGRAELRGSGDLAQQHWTGALTLLGADLKLLLAQLAGVDAVRGRGEVTAELEAAGDSPAALIGSLAGTVHVVARNGIISGFDLPAVSERIARAGRPTDLIEVTRAGAGGQTPFSQLQGQFRITRGVARTDDLRLLARKGEAQTRGTVDLPRWTLDLVNELRVTEPADTPPLLVKLDGPIASPRSVFDISRLQAYLVKRGSGASVKGR